MNRQQVIKSVKKEFENMQCMPLFEFELLNDEYLIVNLYMVKKGIEFHFDSNNLPVAFSGDVIKTGDDVYLIKCDEYNTTLDCYLEAISGEIVDGYIMNNGLYAL